MLDILDLKDSKGTTELKELMDRTKFWSGGNRATNIGKAMEFITDVKFGNIEDRGEEKTPDALEIKILQRLTTITTEDKICWNMHTFITSLAGLGSF